MSVVGASIGDRVHALIRALHVHETRDSYIAFFDSEMQLRLLAEGDPLEAAAVERLLRGETSELYGCRIIIGSRTHMPPPVPSIVTRGVGDPARGKRPSQRFPRVPRRL